MTDACGGVRSSFPSIRPVIRPFIHPSNFLIPKEEDDGRIFESGSSKLKISN
jgi:hypothetical protein